MPSPPSLPHIGGADGAGVVDVLGEGVTHVAVGDEVVIDPTLSCGRCSACSRGDVPFCDAFGVLGEHRWGTHAESVTVPVANVVRKPSHLSWSDAGSFGLVVSSAVRMLRRARLERDENVLVVGVGGGSATAAFLVALAFGATVYVTTSRRDKGTWAVRHGAAAVYETRDDYDDAVRSATGGKGADIVVDNVGGATFVRSMKSLAKGGRLVTNGSTSGRTAELHLPTLFWRQLEVIGASMNNRDEFGEAVNLVADGEVSVPVDSIVPFDDLPTALHRLESGDQLGKIVLGR